MKTSLFLLLVSATSMIFSGCVGVERRHERREYRRDYRWDRRADRWDRRADRWDRRADRWAYVRYD